MTWLAVILVIWLAPALVLFTFLLRAMNAPSHSKGAAITTAIDVAEHDPT
jgi:hypothetical protein